MTHKYFPHNWNLIKDSPPEFFPSISYKEMKADLQRYELLDSVQCLVRATDRQTGMVKEKYFETNASAKRYVTKCMQEHKDFIVVGKAGTVRFLKNDDPSDPTIDFNQP